MNSKSESKNNDTKKIATLVILILTVMISTTGATHAYFQISASNTTAMTGTAATVELSLEVTRETPDTTKWNASNKVMVPQLSTALGTAMNATNKCVDGNSNVVCEVFKIVITNGSTSSVRLRGAVFFPGIIYIGDKQQTLIQYETIRFLRQAHQKLLTQQLQKQKTQHWLQIYYWHQVHLRLIMLQYG